MPYTHGELDACNGSLVFLRALKHNDEHGKCDEQLCTTSCNTTVFTAPTQWWLLRRHHGGYGANTMVFTAPTSISNRHGCPTTVSWQQLTSACTCSASFSAAGPACLPCRLLPAPSWPSLAIRPSCSKVSPITTPNNLPFFFFFLFFSHSLNYFFFAFFVVFFL